MSDVDEDVDMEDADDEQDVPMEGDVDDELDAKVDEINNNTTSARTKAVYASKQISFLMFLDHAHPEVLSEDFLHDAPRSPDGSLQRSYVKKVVQERKRPAPINFSLLEARHVTRFILTLKKKNGEEATNSVHNSARSAVTDLFRTYDFITPKKMTNALQKFFKGLKRKSAKDAGMGQGKAYVGKKPLEFALYRFLCKELLRFGNTESLFVHAMLVLSWNLMTR